MKDAFLKTPDELLKDLGTDSENGLTPEATLLRSRRMSHC